MLKVALMTLPCNVWIQDESLSKLSFIRCHYTCHTYKCGVVVRCTSTYTIHILPCKVGSYISDSGVVYLMQLYIIRFVINLWL